MINKTIAIAGLGWLGQPLAYRLATLGYTVKGSVTSIEKATLLQQNGFETYPVEISEMGIDGEITALLNNVDFLIIMIPPGLRKNTGADYVLKMVHLIAAINESTVKKIILISSTSVYDDSQGRVTEKDDPKPTTLAGKQLRQVEELFINAEGLQTTVVRFGGLIGGSRNPVKYLAGRNDLANGNAPINLIHRDDCINILVEKNTTIKISGIDKELVGKVTSEIKKLKPVEPYKGKGIKEKGQYVLRKEGKKK